jgi:hypothetical protein
VGSNSKREYEVGKSRVSWPLAVKLLATALAAPSRTASGTPVALCTSVVLMMLTVVCGSGAAALGLVVTSCSCTEPLE